MKELVLSTEELAEEVLVSYKGRTFKIKNARSGQYGFERKVVIYILFDNLEIKHFKTVGIVRLFSSNDIYKESTNEQCLVKGDTNFNECLSFAKEYIKKHIDFIIM